VADAVADFAPFLLRVDPAAELFNGDTAAADDDDDDNNIADNNTADGDAKNTEALVAVALSELRVGTDEEERVVPSEATAEAADVADAADVEAVLVARAQAVVYAAQALARGELVAWHQGVFCTRYTGFPLVALGFPPH
jgi:hypothetical protein